MTDDTKLARSPLRWALIVVTTLVLGIAALLPLFLLTRLPAATDTSYDDLHRWAAGISSGKQVPVPGQQVSTDSGPMVVAAGKDGVCWGIHVDNQGAPQSTDPVRVSKTWCG